MLLEDDSDDEVSFKINKNYANRYDTWRQKEELQKLKDRYGEGALKNGMTISDDSSSSEDEFGNAEHLTEQFEKDFFKTLSCLKKKDPKIYDKDTAFFNDTPITSTQKEVKTSKNDEKPMFLRDYERKLIVEREGKFSEDEDEDNKKRPQSPTIVEEEKLIKEGFKSVLKDSEDEDDKAWGGLFQKRHKTKEEAEKEEEHYREWLKGQKEEIADKTTETELKYLHDYWNDPELNSDEKFLRDYILNKRFLADDEEGNDYIPTYQEIVHDSDDNLSEDEKTLSKQEEFEHKFNFRFEEPDQEFLKRFPRTMENSLRKKDDRRKKKRQEIRERKEAMEAKKREELKRLKGLKRKEIMDKIEKLKEITGNDEVGFKDEDIEGDFDPNEHDRRMRELFNSEFYDVEDRSKPEFPELDEELEIENWNDWNGEQSDHNECGPEDEEHETHCEDPDFNMDCDYDPTSQFQNELIKSIKGKKGRKWKSKFAEAVAKKKPVFDSSNRTFDEYLDEYYKLDFEDLIGDLPCRFKYRKVLPNNFGLSVEEILQADDKELNNWCSLKRAVQHRPEHVETYDVQAYRKKGMNEQLKKKIFHSIYEEPKEEDAKLPVAKKKKSKKKKHSATEGDSEIQADSNFENKISKEPTDEDAENNAAMKKKKSKKRKHSSIEDSEVQVDSSVGNVNSSESAEVFLENNAPKKRKKSKKGNHSTEDGSEYYGDGSFKNRSTKHEASEGKSDGDIIEGSLGADGHPNSMQQKKKKHKKLAEESVELDGDPRFISSKRDTEEINTTISSGGEELFTKKKQKKPKLDSTENVHNDNSSKKSKGNKNNTLNSGNTEASEKKINYETKQDSQSSNMQGEKMKKKKKKNNAEVPANHKVQTSNKGEFNKHKTNKFSKKKNKNNEFHRKKYQNEAEGPSISDARLRAYGINPKKYKNKLKYGNKTQW